MSQSNCYERCDTTKSKHGFFTDCPYDCGLNCKRNTAKRRAQGKKMQKALRNATSDDLQWLNGTGRYAQ